MESQANQEKAGKKDTGNRNSSEDSDVLDIVFEKTAAKIQNPPENQVECICLSDSDSDNVQVAFSSEPPKNVTVPPTATSRPTVDYLNLGSSDTDDDEQERIQSDVNNLLSSAAILNDIECGPAKPIPELNALLSCATVTFPPSPIVTLPPSPTVTLPPHTTVTFPPGPSVTFPTVPLPPCIDNPPLVGKSPSSPPIFVINDRDDKDNSTSLSVDISGDKICSQEGISNEKIKPGLLNTEANVTEGAVEEPDPRIRMYRKDERIVAAFENKVASHIPSTLSQSITAHSKSISSLNWCAVPHSHLFLSSSLDGSVKVWDIYSMHRPIQTLNIPLGVRAAKWSKCGEQIIAGGFGKNLHVIDVLSGLTHMTYNIRNFVSCIAIHPFIDDVVLCGTKNAILGFDLRVDSDLPVRTYRSKCGEILDIAFLNKEEFVCSGSVVSHDSADRTIMVWDFHSGARMSKQIFLERYTCPSLKKNPRFASFIAQTNGGYIASFSSQRPYKIKNKRYMGHKVSGYAIECDISPDGQYIASGDANGDVYFYNHTVATEVNKLTVKPDVATNRLQWHPVLSSTMAVATWDGQIHVLK